MLEDRHWIPEAMWMTLFWPWVSLANLNTTKTPPCFPSSWIFCVSRAVKYLAAGPWYYVKILKFRHHPAFLSVYLWSATACFTQDCDFYLLQLICVYSFTVRCQFQVKNITLNCDNVFCFERDLSQIGKHSLRSFPSLSPLSRPSLEKLQTLCA